MTDAPDYRLWPPLALGLPLIGGIAATAADLDPVSLPSAVRGVGWAFVAGCAVWNGWGMVLMARHRTGLLPGQAATTVLERGPFRVSRNPLYLGLIALDTGLALLWPSFWALVLVPVGIGLLTWGAILPEERYLRAKFGAAYIDYTSRVRRWL